MILPPFRKKSRVLLVNAKTNLILSFFIFREMARTISSMLFDLFWCSDLSKWGLKWQIKLLHALEKSLSYIILYIFFKIELLLKVYTAFSTSALQCSPFPENKLSENNCPLLANFWWKIFWHVKKTWFFSPSSDFYEKFIKISIIVREKAYKTCFIQ